jgi:predicted RNase H-like HicB family nuclease
MKKDIAVYPVYLTAVGDGSYSVYVPDIDRYTQGKDLADAIYMARDLIGSMDIAEADLGRELAAPFSSGYRPGGDEVLSYVDIDFAAYRSRHDHKMVRKNCTIPRYIEAAASKRGLNFSRVLSEALAERLHFPFAAGFTDDCFTEEVPDLPVQERDF